MRDQRLNEIVAIDIGLYVQAVALLELELDDLLCLANSRIDVVGLGTRNYPVQMSQKLLELPKIAQAVSSSSLDECQSPFLSEVLEMRHSFVHGRVTGVSWNRHGYEFTVSKIGLPDNKSGKAILSRKPTRCYSLDFLTRALELQNFAVKAEVLRKAVFQAGDGWPTYRVLPEGDPLGLKKLVERFSMYSTDNVRQV